MELSHVCHRQRFSMKVLVMVGAIVVTTDWFSQRNQNRCCHCNWYYHCYLIPFGSFYLFHLILFYFTTSSESSFRILFWLFLSFSALGQIMLYVDGMNGVIGHPETIQWLYTLVGSKVSSQAYILKNSENTHTTLPLVNQPLFAEHYF